MSGYFSPLVDRYLLNWLGTSTWVTMHHKDMVRFYKFMRALMQYGRKDPLKYLDAGLLLAAKDKHPNLDDAHIEEIIGKYVGIAWHIIHYVRAPFPDPLVEMQDPIEVDLYLRRFRKDDEKGLSQPAFPPEERERILEENFGKDWRNDPRSRK